MAEHEDLTGADDALVRRALATLRTDVEATPLPDVAFVKARGRALRRRRLATWGAAAAAAVVVAGTAGYAVLGPSGDIDQPLQPASRGASTAASPSSAPSATTTTPAASPYLDQQGALPLGSEWKLALAWPSPFTMETASKESEADPCWASGSPTLRDLGTRVQDQNVLSATGNIQGRQTRWTVTRTPAEQVATAQASSIGSCSIGEFKVTGVQTSGWPRLYSYTAGGAGSGWYAVVASGSQVAVLNVVEPDHPRTRFTSAQVGLLATIATERLQRYAGAPSGPPTSGPPAALDEQMPVSGPDPKPSSRLFVAASQWRSTALTGGARTSAGPGALEGSTAVASCETDQQQAGIGGRVGVVSVRVGTSSSGYVGRQRVQQDESTDAAAQQAYVTARLGEARTLFGKGCSYPNGTVRSTPGPSAGTWRLDSVSADGTTALTEWVGVTAQQSPGTVSTIVLTKVADPRQGFAELDRLLALARQK